LTGKKANSRRYGLVFFPSMKMTLDIFHVCLVPFKNLKLSIDECFVGSFVLIIAIAKFGVVFIKSLVNKIIFRFNQRMQMVMTFQEHKA